MREKIIRLIDRLSDAGAYLSSILLVIIIVLIVSNIALMGTLGKSIMITDEYSAYMFAGFVMFGLGYTLKENGHIRINVLTSHLPKKIQFLFDVLRIVIAFLLSGFMLYYSVVMVKQAYIYQMRADTVAQTLIWIPQLCMPIGFAILWLQLLSELLKVVKK